MTATYTGQLILGTDKRNPLFTVYAQEEEGEEQLHVYYGLELLEVVSADRNEPSFKMLVGRLYNAGVSLRVLQQTFQTDVKTIQRWGRALRSRNAEELIRVLEGRRAHRKLSAEIKAYARVRWPQLAKEGLYGIGKRLRQEIQSVFGVTLSQETLRPLMGELKGEQGSSVWSGMPKATTAGDLPQDSQSVPEDQALSPEAWEKPCGCAAAQAATESPTVARLAAAPQTLWCDHLGVLSFVVDRAIFGKEVFEKVRSDPTLHLITWEKGYQRQDWPPPGGIRGAMVIERARNRAEDIRSYHLEYWDRAWPKDPRLRQIVVQATNPRGRVIQVSILTDDQQSAASVIIQLMFGRWVQENDFKYLDKHFGINQITSYGVTAYEELRQQVEDRQMRSVEVKALAEQRRQNRAAQSRLLLLQSKGEHAASQRQQRIQELEKQPEADPPNKELVRLRQVQSRWESTRVARQEQIQKLSSKLAQLAVDA